MAATTPGVLRLIPLKLIPALTIVGAAVAGWLTWRTRDVVGLDPGRSCTLDPAWRVQLSWWLFAASTIALLVAAADAVRAVRANDIPRLVQPALGFVLIAAVVFLVEYPLIGGIDVGCREQNPVLLDV